MARTREVLPEKLKREFMSKPKTHKWTFTALTNPLTKKK